MFNLSGSELIFLLLLALIVLGPEKLPEAIRRFGKTYAEVRKMTTGFQSELKQALDEPMREMRETADAVRKAATVDGIDSLMDSAKSVIQGESTPSRPTEAVTTAETVGEVGPTQSDGGENPSP